VDNIEKFYDINIIDDDFDEIFYGKEYAETANFYQPHCKTNGIDERHRLFYHYKLYGANRCKNLLEKNKHILVPNVAPRERVNNKLAIITSLFNPCNYININKNYLKFSLNIKKYADLFPVELSFNNDFFIEDNNVIRINGCPNNTLWQKEVLLNIALANLSSEYTDVAWIDCDIIFENEDWVSQLSEALNNYKIVQLFREGYKLDINDTPIPCKSLLHTFPKTGEAGFAWAARREILDEIKLLDNQFFGGADFIMAAAFMNKPHLIDNLSRYINNDDTKQWFVKAQKIVNRSVGYIDSTITHLYHGNIYNREYTRQIYRQQLISSINLDRDITKVNGLWSVSDEHLENSLKYFLARQEDDNINIQKFLERQFDSHEECLDFYIQYVCENVMHTNPLIICQVRDKMINSITKYAQTYSNKYKQYSADTIFTRQHLDSKDDWICKNISPERIMHQHTSGSTTGEQFNYCGDSKYFDFIQQSSEFELILKEYHLYNKPLKILNLFKHSYNPKPTYFYLETKNYSSCRFHTYGASDSTTYFVNWDGYMENPDDWHNKLLCLLQETSKFDIVLGSGPVFNILSKYIKKNNFKKHFAFLLSHTTEFPRISDFQFLKDNGNITHYCDHMRCYDGGANFFTCKYGTYHLNDHLSWVAEGSDNKLISTDYFNMASPFINYWNGDLCEIKDEYHLCECGRYYRPFKMLQNRPFALKGPTKLTEIRNKIGELSFKNKINQVQFENLNVNIHCESMLNQREKEIIDNILKDYKTNYF
jgi:hypothetical protein